MENTSHSIRSPFSLAEVGQTTTFLLVGVAGMDERRRGQSVRHGPYALAEMLKVKRVLPIWIMSPSCNL
jgi:hypothetical protein